MKKFISLQFEDYVLNEVQILFDTLQYCLEDINDAESESSDDIKLFSTCGDVLCVDDVRALLSDVIEKLHVLKDTL